MRYLFSILILILIFSCKSNQEDLDYLGFWESYDGNYLLLKKNKTFKLFWPVFSKELINGRYQVDLENNSLNLEGKDFDFVWSFRLSSLKLFLFLKDLKEEEFVFYKSNQKFFEKKIKEKKEELS